MIGAAVLAGVTVVAVCLAICLSKKPGYPGWALEATTLPAVVASKTGAPQTEVSLEATKTLSDVWMLARVSFALASLFGAVM